MLGLGPQGVQGDDAAMPSVFEVVAVSRLASSLRPAVDHLLVVLAQRFPWFVRVAMQRDEVVTALHLALEVAFLRRFGATFAENFYDLKRVVVKAKGGGGGSGGGGLAARKDVVLAIVGTVVLPYIAHKARRKFDQLQDHLRAELLSHPHRAPRLARHWRLFHRLYPHAHLCAEVVATAYWMAFAFGRSRFPTWHMHAAGQHLRRLHLQEMVGRVGGKSGDDMTMADFALEYARHLFLFSVMGYKFLEWWYGNDGAHAKPSSSPFHLSPPPPALPVAGCHALPADVGKCAICKRSRHNPTATPTGFVFCYRCVYDHVSVHRTCPITALPVRVEALRRVYQS